MQITRHDLNPCTVKLDVICDAEVIKEGVDRAFKQAAKKIKVPGFRPGTAPRSMLKNLIPDDEMLDLAAESVVKLTFKKAIEENSLEPYRTPKVQVTAINLEEPKCEYTVTVPLKPQVKLGSLDELQAEQPGVVVTEAEIDEQIDEIRKRRSTRETVTDRGAHEGDSAVVNITPSEEGATGRNFMTVVGQTFPGLDDALKGMSVDEVKSLTLAFPASFSEKDWAGKEIECKVTLRSLTTAKLPELDEGFAKALNAESVDELRTLVRAGMERAKQSAVEDYVNEQLLESLLQQSEVVVPDTLWEDVAQRKLRAVAEELHEEGKSVEDYAQGQGMTVEQLVTAIETESQTQVRRAQLINEIFVNEKMTITDRELTAEVIRMAQEMQMEPKALWETLKKNNATQEVTHQAIHRKVLDFMRSKAKLVETTGNKG